MLKNTLNNNNYNINKVKNTPPHKHKIQKLIHNTEKQNGPLLHTAEKKQEKSQNCSRMRK
jgi:arsenate reductase-like glutaredoxin family protein